MYVRDTSRSENEAARTGGSQASATESEIVERRRGLRPWSWSVGTSYSAKWSAKPTNGLCFADLMCVMSSAKVEFNPLRLNTKTRKAAFSSEPESPGISPLSGFSSTHQCPYLCLTV